MRLPLLALALIVAFYVYQGIAALTAITALGPVRVF